MFRAVSNIFPEHGGMATATSSPFGTRLRSARLRVGLPQDRLGVLAGLDELCSSPRISYYESGKHAPSFRTAERLAEVLGVPVAYFYCPDEMLAELLLLAARLAVPEQEQLLAVAQKIKGHKQLL
jgi:transcriptional regulator with XRE-family HTH domain